MGLIFGGGGTPIWSVPPGAPNPNPISDQKMSFVTPAVSDLAFKKLFHHGLRLDSPAAIKKDFLNPFLIRIFLFLSYSLGIETINTFVDSSSSQTKTAQKNLPSGAAHSSMDYIGEYPPGP